MSGAANHPGGKDAPNADPSMEDILASIRRILSEDAPQPAALDAPPAKPSDVLVLDQSMMVPEQAEPEPEPASPPPPAQAAPLPPPSAAEGDSPLVAPEVVAAASSAVNSLVRTLASERGTLVRSGGPTIEDMVREELRPMLKQWLDTYLPPLVERLVKAEIERVVGRVVP